MTDPILKDYTDTLQAYGWLSEVCIQLREELSRLEGELQVKRNRMYESLAQQKSSLNRRQYEHSL